VTHVRIDETAWIDDDHLVRDAGLQMGEVHVLTHFRGIAPDHRPDEPIERSKSFGSAGPVGRRPYPRLKFPQRRVCVWSEDAVGPPGVEPELHQSPLQLGDIIADHHVTRHIGEHSITELPARLVESPSYVGALGVFRSYECDIVHVAMDDDGLVPNALRETIESVRAQRKRIKLLYTIPSFQNPAGVTQPAERRQEILEIAQSAGIAVLEDDPYGLLGFEGDPPRALRADDDQGVIYLGSFSKTIASGLRVGWAIAPHGVREKLVLAAEAATLCPSNYSQLTVSEYLATQPWREQIKSFREVYRERRDALLDSLQAMMPEGTRWTIPAGGFYSWVTLPDGLDATAMLPRAVAELVAYVPGTGFYVDGQGVSNMRLSYCYPEPDRIREGVRRLSSVVESELEIARTFGTASVPSPGSPTAPGESSTPGPDVA